MQQVADTLETLLAPGRRFRLSPLVEATQLAVLFGRAPDDRRRAESIRAILERERSQQQLDRIAQAWERFQAANKPFSDRHTYKHTFLRSYLAYYTTSNAPKLQAVLTDLLRVGAFPPPAQDGQRALRVLDIGVGPGTTVLAVLDFLLTWESCCRLWSQPFPLDLVELVGIDRSQPALDYARRVSGAFGRQVQRWIETRQRVLQESGRGDLEWPGRAWAEQIRSAAATARWEQIDLTRAEQLARGQELARWANVIVVSYVLRELRDAGGEDNLSTVLAAAEPGTLVLLLESGTKVDATGLMRWRRRFLRAHPEFRTVIPCGQEFGAELPACCDSCWPSRREGLHQTALYRAFVERCPTLDPSSERYDDFENELLSWTYVVLERQPTAASNRAAPPPRVHILVGKPVSVTTRVVGRFLGLRPLDPNPNEDVSQRSTAKEYIKLCPGCTDVAGLSLWRRPGFAVPSLRHGEMVTLEGMHLARTRNGGLILEPGDGDRSRVVPQRTVQSTATPFLPAYTEAVRDALDDLAYRLFGFPALRRFQHLILQRVLTGRSVLGIAATGSGKSECFILPAMLLPGFTVVVSPLKALMQDQFEQRIRERYGLDFLCTYLNGEVPMRERDRRLRLLEQGYFKLVYITPEQLQRDWVIESLKRAHQKVPGGFRYLAMDEAHCVSQWGHDFRPAYLNIVQRLRQHGLEPNVIALTATASPQVREDLCRELQLDQRPIEQGGDVLVDTANRPELNLIVQVVDSTERKAEEIANQLHTLLARNRADPAKPGAAIVFMPWTEQDDAKPDRASPRVTEFAAWLETELGSKVSIYHGKMDDDPAADAATEDEHGQRAATAPPKELGNMSDRSRRAEQEAFIRGERAIMVATKGFGMGVDKPNIRLVLHRTPPANMEAYWQEAGRAGRDGDLADVVVYFSPDTPDEGTSDYEIQEFFLREKYVRPVDIEAMVAFLRTVQPTRAGTRYFTADEAIAFLERPGSGFLWPDFDPPRHSTWGKHAEILNRGYYYREKCKYLDRIVQALQSFRPFIGDRFVSLVDEVHDCGTELVGVTLAWHNVDRIFDSNLYFGRFLREKERQIPDLRNRFRHLVTRRDVLALADLLALPVHETGALLHDIRQAEGQWQNGANGQRRWRGTLLDFKTIRPPLRGPAAGKTTLQAWRDYAGAFRRALSAVARNRAQRAGRKQPDTDDWFSWQEVSRRRGWEVKLGDAFDHLEQLERYVDAFVEQMGRRERYDWEAYQRFLTEYIGVERTAEGNWKERAGRLPCLRGVVLGYLKTYEVVAGASCLSCSRCVPDLAFSTDLEARRRVIERLRRELAELLEQLERVPDHWLAPGEIDELAAAVSSEIAAGKRVGEYLAGLTDRLLTDTPEHRPALVVRLLAACRGWLELPPEEVVRLAERVIELAHGDSARATVDRLLLQEATRLLPAAPLLHGLRANWLERHGELAGAAAELEQLEANLDSAEEGTWLFQHLVGTRWRLVGLLRRLGHPEEAARRLEWLSEHEPEPAQRRNALETLYETYRDASDDERAEDAALRLARSHEQQSEIRLWYERAGLRRWTPARVVDELVWLRTYRSTQWPASLETLLSTWLSSERSPHVHQLGNELGHRWGEFRPPLALADVLALCRRLGPVETWGDSTLAERYMGMSLAAFTTVTADERSDLAWILARRSGKEISTVHGILSDLAENGVHLGAGALGTMLEALSEKPEAVWNLLETLPRSARLRHPAAWLALLQKDVLERLRPEQQAHALVLLLHSVASEVEPGCLTALLPLVGPRLAVPEVSAAAEQVVPVLIERLDSLPRGPLVELVSALTEAERGPFSSAESALALLWLLLETTVWRPPEDNARCFAGMFRRAAQSSVALKPASVLERVRETLQGTPSLEPAVWQRALDDVRGDLEKAGEVGLYLLALAEGHDQREREAIEYLYFAFDRWAESRGEELREYTELTARTLHHLATSSGQTELSELVDRVLEVCCGRPTWLADRRQATQWMVQHLGQLLCEASARTVAELVVAPEASSHTIAAYFDARRELAATDCQWIDELIAQCEARLAETRADLDFERLDALRTLAKSQAARWKGSEMERLWKARFERSSIGDLRRTGRLDGDRVHEAIVYSSDDSVIPALLDLVPDDWTVSQVNSLAHSIETGLSTGEIHTLVDLVCSKPANEYWAERGLAILMAVRASLLDDRDSLPAIQRWCTAIANLPTRRTDLRSTARDILLDCSSRLAR